MKRIKKLNNKGFSLIELLICLAISAYSLVLVGTRSYDNNNRAAKLQKEVSFTTNILGESIRNGKCENSYIIYYHSRNDIEIHTGERVICYDSSEKSLFIYEEASGTDYWPATPSKQNLVSKYVESFDASFLSKNDKSEVALTTLTDPQTIKATEAVIESVSADPAIPNTLSGTDIIGFEMTFKIDDTADTTEIMYQIRN